MTSIRLGFRVFAADPSRPLSAADVAARIGVPVSNPRAIVAQLRVAGVIAPAHRAGREQFYAMVPGATLPPDGRPDAAARARKAKQKRSLVARALCIRLLKRIETDAAVLQARRIRKLVK